MKLTILREVRNLPDVVEQYLDAHSDIVEYNDGTKWVNNDTPRDQAYTQVIMACSTGRFAVADPDGDIVGGPYNSVKKAETAAASAKIKLAVDVDIDEAEEAEAVVA